MFESTFKYLRTVKVNHFLWQYKSIGLTNGRCYLLIPGFGQSTDEFDFLERDLKKRKIRIIVLGLLFHESMPCSRDWKDIVKLDDLCACISAICKIEQIRSYYLIGYSMGSRVAINIPNCSIHAQINGIFLFAPDGFHNNNWYKFLISTPGRAIFKWIVSNPRFLIPIYRWIQKTNLLGKTEKKVMDYALSQNEILSLVYQTWSAYRKIEVDSSVINQLKSMKIKKFIFGKYDRIITEKSIKFLKDMGINSNEIESWSCGHEIIVQRNKERILELLKVS